MDLTNEEINLAVAIIAGWTEIELWNTHRPEDKSPNPLRVYQGTNAAHPELGKFIPKYTESLDAIVKVFDWFGFDWNVGADGFAYVEGSATFKGCDGKFDGDAPALAMCKLLLAINPAPIAPQVAIIVDDGDVESVFEAEFV